MNNKLRIPDAETRKREIENLRQINRQFDIINFQLDELNASLEADLRQQRRKRLGLPTDKEIAS